MKEMPVLVTACILYIRQYQSIRHEKQFHPLENDDAGLTCCCLGRQIYGDCFAVWTVHLGMFLPFVAYLSSAYFFVLIDLLVLTVVLGTTRKPKIPAN